MMEDVELNNGGENVEGKIYLERLMTEGKVTPIEEKKPEDIKLPPWFDKAKYQRGCDFYNRFNHSIMLCSLFGLIVVIAVETILNILVCTKQSGDSKSAYRRYIRTVFHVFNFYSGPPESNSKCLASIVDVRQRHSRSSKFSEKRSAGIISQRDMAITQFGFMGFALLRQKAMGIRRNEDDLEAFVHVWRVIGFMLGIDDRYNLCTESLEGTQIRAEVMLRHVITPAVIKPPVHFDKMLTAMLDGLWCFIPVITKESFWFITQVMAGSPGFYYTDEQRLSQIEYVQKYGHYVENNKAQIEKELLDNQFVNLNSLHWWDKFVVNFVFYTCHLIYVSEIWRWYFKFHVHLARFLITWFPFLAFPKYGFRQSYVRILVNADKIE